jgi:hypothetical protein
MTRQALAAKAKFAFVNAKLESPELTTPWGKVL